ncbi:MAG: hypothetical protein J7K81_00190 [Methanophagales archaeon]|nr:hypothetical protein [Methanophagales archaeon]
MERANQDAKSELGWDELEAQKYLAWIFSSSLHNEWVPTSSKFFSATSSDWLKRDISWINKTLFARLWSAKMRVLVSHPLDVKKKYKNVIV